MVHWPKEREGFAQGGGGKSVAWLRLEHGLSESYLESRLDLRHNDPSPRLDLRRAVIDVRRAAEHLLGTRLCVGHWM